MKGFNRQRRIKEYITKCNTFTVSAFTWQCFIMSLGEIFKNTLNLQPKRGLLQLHITQKVNYSTLNTLVIFTMFWQRNVTNKSAVPWVAGDLSVRALHYPPCCLYEPVCCPWQHHYNNWQRNNIQVIHTALQANKKILQTIFDSESSSTLKLLSAYMWDVLMKDTLLTDQKLTEESSMMQNTILD